MVCVKLFDPSLLKNQDGPLVQFTDELAGVEMLEELEFFHIETFCKAKSEILP